MRFVAVIFVFLNTFPSLFSLYDSFHEKKKVFSSSFFPHHSPVEVEYRHFRCFGDVCLLHISLYRYLYGVSFEPLLSDIHRGITRASIPLESARGVAAT